MMYRLLPVNEWSLQFPGFPLKQSTVFFEPRSVMQSFLFQTLQPHLVKHHPNTGYWLVNTKFTFKCFEVPTDEPTGDCEILQTFIKKAY